MKDEIKALTCGFKDSAVTCGAPAVKIVRITCMNATCDHFVIIGVCPSHLRIVEERLAINLSMACSESKRRGAKHSTVAKQTYAILGDA